MKEKVKIKDINLRVGNMQAPQVLSVKSLKLHYALGKNRSNYLKHLEPLQVLWLTEDEAETLKGVIGSGISYEIKKQVTLAKTAGLDEISEKLQCLSDALDEEVEVETYQVPSDTLPSDMDGFAYNAISWCVSEPVQVAE